jgi:hypothetical protein
MAISYVSGATAAASTVAMSSHQALDLLICTARGASGTLVPSLPAGWTAWPGTSTSTGTSIALRVGYKIAASGSETTGTWTNANGVLVNVYRGASGPGNISAISEVTSGFSTNNLSYPALTLAAPATSWAMRFGISTTSGTGLNTAITTTPNTLRVGSTAFASFDSNGPVGANIVAGTQTTSVSLACTAFTLAILAATATGQPFFAMF